MRDSASMPKINWVNDKPTLAKIKIQINLQEPLVIYFPEDFNLSVDPQLNNCEIKSNMILGCQPEIVFDALAANNDLPVLKEIGLLAQEIGQIVDIDQIERKLVIYD